MRGKVFYIEAPENLEDAPDCKMIFLAGGITGCPDWQQAMVELLCDTSVTLLNPRRADFPIGDPSAAKEQITWEHDHLRKADAILFWFPCETICPIVLYELGAWSMTDKPIFVGVHPQYPRRQDVEIQTALVRPEVKIVYSLKELAQQVKKFADSTEISEALSVLSAAMQADSHYAMSWHDNIAVMMQDAGASHEVSNDGAARFMKLAFGVTTEKEQGKDSPTLRTASCTDPCLTEG